VAATKTVRAVASFACEINGEEALVHAGDEFPATSDVVKPRPELFEPTESRS